MKIMSAVMVAGAFAVGTTWAAEPPKMKMTTKIPPGLTTPEAPKGKESNWVQTVPGKGWNTILRLYGPLEPWFDKTWRPGEIELVK